MKSTTQRFSVRPKNRLYLLNVTMPSAEASAKSEAASASNALRERDGQLQKVKADLAAAGDAATWRQPEMRPRKR
jgi:hypothetical protein